jgi:predicted O-linked N-acetylglucosamine transferase (SPINDLY family)
VQVSWLGYFATTGVAEIDHLIGDPWTLPDSEAVHFTENIWRLPQTRLCFTAPACSPLVNDLPAASNGALTFGCFNNVAKVTDDVVAVWARVLRAVSNGRLLLKSPPLREPALRHALIDKFAAHGIGADRLTLEGLSSREDYLARYGQVDIALDPFPFPGGTTSVESMWMGVPVLTMSGKSFLARQGLGLMMNVGLPDWVAADADDYVRLAATHAADLAGLAELRAGLRQRMLGSPLMDAPRFAAHLQEALRGMWQQHCDRRLTFKAV